MNYKQYLLIKLAEEASEIAQAAIKCSLFGYESKDPREVNGKTNIQKLLCELADLSAVTDLLGDTEDFDNDVLESIEPEKYIESKRTKLKYYFDISQQINKETK